jgi:hypothetical protein
MNVLVRVGVHGRGSPRMLLPTFTAELTRAHVRFRQPAGSDLPLSSIVSRFSGPPAALLDLLGHFW